MKKKCFFIFSGQPRTFPFSLNPKNFERSTHILNSYNNLIFTDKFKELFDYKVFFSTDDLHLGDTINYFGNDKIGNIHLLDTDYYHTNIKNKINNFSYFIDRYNKNDFGNCRKYINSIAQHHKILDCYNMARHDNDFKNIKYLIRIRMDISLEKNILELIQILENKPEIKIIMSCDHFAIGNPHIMNKYCTGLENNYGKYPFYQNIPYNVNIMNYNGLDRIIWTYAPEKQLYEMLFEYCIQNNLNINNTLLDLFAQKITNLIR